MIPADEGLLYQLRPATDGDLAFMRVLYGQTREDELAVTGWEREQKEVFIDHQFSAQTAHYHLHMPGAQWHIITLAGEDAGRLVLDHRKGEHRIVDITLHSGFRGRGTGTAILRDLQASAAAAGCSLSIHVEHQNPARQLYERLGFEAKPGDSEVYQLMEWRSC
ncbi:GNAT family N-acetyltransferase [Luteolibacter sp. GHJ8]|uniref:GNAT family N-acetyltransferase n=1 Tax=Luteolibacter rhizosphaerae TaxID=2989719 RepID=A0ABT3G4Z5_9BACT|nr:GNAT family N-acetyltransferase [Luteolibacter rhizosphaerae]MCW1914902.1 GNAT family N-acetyltransferase [Luteolibacter rhizosphaerae]